MARRTLEDAFNAGYLAGFQDTGEGYNNEYPFNTKDIYPETDIYWIESRTEAYRRYKKELK